VTGTQSAPWGTIANRRRRFALPQLFVFRVGPTGSIERIAAYWDGADFREQLGAVEVE
jgi:hypothetical protein